MSAGIDVGHVVAGKFELVRLLGRGSMGEVWVAHHLTLGEHVALKLLTPSAGGEVREEEATAAERFRFEAQIAARLSRKTRHIVRVTDHGDEGGLTYLVMELLEGETLDALMTRTPGRMPLDVAVDIVTQIGRALAQAHAEGVFHRDLKPANVFVTHDEEGRSLLKVLDFGIARAIHAHRVRGTFATAKGLVFGTPGYMSPEQARASATLDHRCDLWALAVIAYEALTGALPVDGTDADEVIKNLCAGRVVPLRDRWRDAPEALAAFFDKAFADAVDDRYANANDLATAFARAAGVGAVPEPQPSSPRVSRPEAPGEESAAASEEEPPEADTALSPQVRRERVRMIWIAAGAVVGLTALGVAWRALAPTAAAPEAVAPGTASPVAAVSGAPAAAEPAAAGATVDDPPATAVSSLPRGAPRPLSAARGPMLPMVSAPPPQPPPPRPAPAAPHPQSKASRDKSEVL